MILGAHMSIAGGLENAVKDAVAHDCTALQIFTRNASRWRAKPLADGQVEAWQEAVDHSGIGRDALVVHDSYLINLATEEPEKRKKSIEAQRDEIERCSRLGIRLLVGHPGSHLGIGEDKALANLVEAYSFLVRETEGSGVVLCLETTAGQGTNMGWRFEHLAAIIDGVGDDERIGVCLDTCHVFTAGYDIRTEAGYQATMEEFDRVIGLERLRVLHLNDSKKPLGSRVDRHEHIGEGEIGIDAFRFIMNDPNLAALPKIIETHKTRANEDGTETEMDGVNLALLRSL